MNKDVFTVYFENCWFFLKMSNYKVTRVHKCKLFCVLTFYARPIDKAQYSHFKGLLGPKYWFYKFFTTKQAKLRRAYGWYCIFDKPVHVGVQMGHFGPQTHWGSCSFFNKSNLQKHIFSPQILILSVFYHHTSQTKAYIWIILQIWQTS